jgi:hypothetical protein
MAQQQIASFTYGSSCGGGLEMNPARVKAYIDNQCDVCTGTSRQNMPQLSVDCSILGFTSEPDEDEVMVYTPSVWDTPATDPAPWYDSEVPESARFFGFYAESMTGLDSTVSRTVTTRVSAFGGGVMGPLRAAERRMEFTVLLFGCDDNALDYGFRFLANQLGQQGCTTCETCDAEVRTSCVPIAGEEPTDAEWNTGLWQLRGVGLVEGPLWEDPPVKNLSHYVRRARFTLASEYPWLYKCQTMCTEAEVPEPPTTDVCEICEFFGGVSTICCPMVEPLNIGETVPIISIYSGAEGLSDVTITITPDVHGYLVGGVAAPTGWVPPDTCSEIIIPFIPPSSTFVLDGTTETLSVKLPSGQVADGTPYIEPEPGTSISFPSVSCGRYAICVNIGGGGCGVSGDEHVTIETVHREL